MAKLDTGAFSAVTTQSDLSEAREIEVRDAAPPGEVVTRLHDVAGSVPSGLPEMLEAEADKYVFRIGGAPRSPRLTIVLDMKQVSEQTRVRKINRAIRRAHQR